MKTNSYGAIWELTIWKKKQTKWRQTVNNIDEENNNNGNNPSWRMGSTEF